MIALKPLELTPLRDGECLTCTEVMNAELTVVKAAIFSVLDKRFNLLIRQYRFVVGLFSHSIPYCVMYAVK